MAFCKMTVADVDIDTGAGAISITSDDLQLSTNAGSDALETTGTFTFTAESNGLDIILGAVGTGADISNAELSVIKAGTVSFETLVAGGQGADITVGGAITLPAGANFSLTSAGTVFLQNAIDYNGIVGTKTFTISTAGDLDIAGAITDSSTGDGEVLNIDWTSDNATTGSNGETDIRANINTGGGSFTISAFKYQMTVADVDVDAGAGNITLSIDDVELSANSGSDSLETTGTITITSRGTTGFNLGSAGTGPDISNAELNVMKAGTIVLGDTTNTTTFNVGGAITIPSLTNLTLNANTAITVNGVINFNGLGGTKTLTMLTNGGITLNSAISDSSTGDGDTLNIDLNADSDFNGGTLAVNANITTIGSVSLSTGSYTQADFDIDAGAANIIIATNNFTMSSNTGNDALQTTGKITLQGRDSTQDIQIGTAVGGSVNFSVASIALMQAGTLQFGADSPGASVDVTINSAITFPTNTNVTLNAGVSVTMDGVTSIDGDFVINSTNGTIAMNESITVDGNVDWDTADPRFIIIGDTNQGGEERLIVNGDNRTVTLDAGQIVFRGGTSDAVGNIDLNGSGGSVAITAKTEMRVNIYSISTLDATVTLTCQNGAVLCAIKSEGDAVANAQIFINTPTASNPMTFIGSEIGINFFGGARVGINVSGAGTSNLATMNVTMGADSRIEVLNGDMYGTYNITSNESNAILEIPITGGDNLTFAGSASTWTLSAATLSNDNLNLSVTLDDDASDILSITTDLNTTGTIALTTGLLQSINIANDVDIDAGSSNITITADDVSIGTNDGDDALETTGTVTILPSTVARQIDVGTETGGKLSLTDIEMNDIKAGTLVIGGTSITGDITISSNISTINSALTFTTAGTFISIQDVDVDAGAKNISVNADTVTINTNDGGDALETTGTVTIAPITASKQIDVGTETGGKLSLTNTEINDIKAGTLVIGDTTNSGDLTISSNISTTNGGLTFTTAGNFIVLQDIDVDADTKDITVNSNDVAISTNAGSDALETTGTLTIKPITSTAINVGFVGTGMDISNTELNVLKAGTIVIGDTINTNQLSIRGAITLPSGADVTFTSGNHLDNLSGPIDYHNIGGTQTLTLNAVGDIDIVATIFDSTTGDSDVLNIVMNSDTNTSGTDGQTDIRANINTGGGTFDVTAFKYQMTVADIDVDAGAGNITLSIDDVELSLNAGSDALETTGTLKITSRGTTGFNVGSTGTGPDISNAELNVMKAGTIIFGDTSTTNAFTIGGAITLPAGANVTFTSGGDLNNISGNIDYNGIGSKTLTLNATGDIDIVGTITDTSTGDGDLLNIAINADSDISGAGTLDIRGIINTGGGTLTIVSKIFEMTVADIDVDAGAGNITITTDQVVLQTNAGSDALETTGTVAFSNRQSGRDFSPCIHIHVLY